MQDIRIRTNAAEGVILALIITAVVIGSGLLIASGRPEAAVALVLALVLWLSLRALYLATTDAEPQPPEYESNQVLAMRLPCGACGQLRLLEELRPHDIHWRVCRDGLCRRRDEQDVA